MGKRTRFLVFGLMVVLTIIPDYDPCLQPPLEACEGRHTSPTTTFEDRGAGIRMQAGEYLIDRIS